MDKGFDGDGRCVVDQTNSPKVAKLLFEFRRRLIQIDDIGLGAG